jgi:hypothetical protein
MPGDIVLTMGTTGGVFHRYSNGGYQYLEIPPSARNDKEMIASAMREGVRGKTRLWLVQMRTWTWSSTKLGYAKEWLDMHYEEIINFHKDETEIANIRIYCYDLTKNKFNK